MLDLVVSKAPFQEAFWSLDLLADLDWQHFHELVGRLLHLHANQREDIDALHAGEIGGMAGVKQVTTGDTLCAEHQPVLLERIVFPEPVIAMAIEPRSQADRPALDAALAALAEQRADTIAAQLAFRRAAQL